MPPRITPSRGERAEACAFSTSAPGWETEGAAATKGTGVHEYLRRARVVGRDAALAEIPHDAAHRKMCERIDLAKLPWFDPPAGAIVHTERSVGYDPATNTTWELDGGERNYAAVGEWQTAGTPDVDVLDGDMVTVTDIKTGAPHQTTRVRDNFQLMLYALMLCALFGVRRARIVVAFIFEDGSVWLQSHELDAIDLREIRFRLVDAIARVRALIELPADGDIRPYVRRGEHCKYCPRFVECPAQLAILRAFLDAARQKAPTEIGPNDVGEAREFARDAKAWIEKLDEVVKGYARVEDVPTSKPGIVYREWTGTEKEIVNAKRALKVLGERYGADVAEAAITEKTSVTAITDALRDWAKANGRKMDPTVREAFDVLKAAGAVIDAETRKVREGRAA